MTTKEILIIDDTRYTRLLLKIVLESAGFLVHEASLAQVGLKIAEARVPHIILLSANLHSEVAFEFTELFSKSFVSKHIPVTVMAGEKELSILKERISIKDCKYLSKPYSPIELLDSVNLGVRSSRLHVSRLNPNLVQASVTVTTLGTVIYSNEASCVLEVPIKMSSKSQVKIQSAWFTELGWDRLVFVKSPNDSRAEGSGLFSNELMAAAQKADFGYTGLSTKDFA